MREGFIQLNQEVKAEGGTQGGGRGLNRAHRSKVECGLIR